MERIMQQQQKGQLYHHKDKHAYREWANSKLVTDGLQTVDVPGDGDCFFHAVLYSNPTRFGGYDAVRLRLELCDFIANNPGLPVLGASDNPKGYRSLQEYYFPQDHNNISFDDFLIQLRKPRHIYAETLMIFALVNKFQIILDVYDLQTGRIERFEPYDNEINGITIIIHERYDTGDGVCEHFLATQVSDEEKSSSPSMKNYRAVDLLQCQNKFEYGDEDQNNTEKPVPEHNNQNQDNVDNVSNASSNSSRLRPARKTRRYYSLDAEYPNLRHNTRQSTNQEPIVSLENIYPENLPPQSTSLFPTIRVNSLADAFRHVSEMMNKEREMLLNNRRKRNK